MAGLQHCNMLAKYKTVFLFHLPFIFLVCFCTPIFFPILYLNLILTQHSLSVTVGRVNNYLSNNRKRCLKGRKVSSLRSPFPFPTYYRSANVAGIYIRTSSVVLGVKEGEGLEGNLGSLESDYWVHAGYSGGGSMITSREDIGRKY